MDETAALRELFQNLQKEHAQLQKESEETKLLNTALQSEEAACSIFLASKVGRAFVGRLATLDEMLAIVEKLLPAVLETVYLVKKSPTLTDEERASLNGALSSIRSLQSSAAMTKR